jgi:hypothetical protein
MALQDVMRIALSDEVRRAVWQVLKHQDNYTRALVHGVRALRALQGKLQDVQRSQYLEHHGMLHDTYYAIPIAVFVARAAIRAQCAQAAGTEDDEDMTAMRDALQENYPLETVLPIGPSYEDCPFRVITSHDLRAMRHALFRRGSILVSREMNVLALLLACDRDHQ